MVNNSLIQPSYQCAISTDPQASSQSARGKHFRSSLVGSFHFDSFQSQIEVLLAANSSVCSLAPNLLCFTIIVWSCVRAIESGQQHCL